MTPYPYIPNFLRLLITKPADELNRGQKTARYIFDLIRHCTGELRHDKAGQMAAALTYHTLFSLLPTIVLILVALKMFVGPVEREQFKTMAVEWVVDSLQSKAEQPTNTQNQQTGEANSKAEFEAVRARLNEMSQGVVSKLEKINFGSIGVIGVLVFLYGAVGLLATIERSFNSIFGVAYGRSIYVRFPLYFTTLILGPVVLLAGQFMQNRFLEILADAGALTSRLVEPAIVAAPLVTMWLVLYVIYVLMPNTIVSKRAAMIGSLVSAIILLAVREGFRWYVSHAAIASLYGALALLPLFLLFVWVLWLIVLFGLELTYTLGAMKGRQFKRHRNRPQEQQIIDPAWMVPLAVRIAEVFAVGDTCKIEGLRKKIRLPDRALRRMLSALESAGIVHIVGARDDKEQFSLARPADAIRVDDVLKAAEQIFPEVNSPADSDPAWSMVSRIQDAKNVVAHDKTLADLIAKV